MLASFVLTHHCSLIPQSAGTPGKHVKSLIECDKSSNVTARVLHSLIDSLSQIPAICPAPSGIFDGKFASVVHANALKFQNSIISSVFIVQNLYFSIILLHVLSYESDSTHTSRLTQTFFATVIESRMIAAAQTTMYFRQRFHPYRKTTITSSPVIHSNERRFLPAKAPQYKYLPIPNDESYP